MARTKKPVVQKRPTWSIWKDKTDGKIHGDIEWLCRQKYDYATKTYLPGHKKQEDFEAIDPSTFRLKAALKFQEITSGRSSIHFHFKDLMTEMEYIMLPRDMEKLLNKSILQMGAVHGSWGFVKKGSTVAIFLDEEILEEEEPDNNST